MDFEALSHQISTHFLTLAEQTGRVFLALLLALFILVVGLYISRFVGAYAKKLLGRIDFDAKTDKLGINELCLRFGLGKSPTYIISFVLAWAVIFYAVVLAADVLHLSILRDLFTRFLEFIPTLFVSVFILFGGMLLGKLLGRIVENSAQANNLRSGALVGRLVQGFVVFFCALVAVENLGLAQQLITSVAVVVLSAIGLAFSIAVGLGARPLAEEVLRDMFVEKASKKK